MVIFAVAPDLVEYGDEVPRYIFNCDTEVLEQDLSWVTHNAWTRDLQTKIIFNTNDDVKEKSLLSVFLDFLLDGFVLLLLFKFLLLLV